MPLNEVCDKWNQGFQTDGFFHSLSVDDFDVPHQKIDIVLFAVSEGMGALVRNYTYCAETDPGWELHSIPATSSSPLPSATVCYLEAIGAIHPIHTIRRKGEQEWSQLSDLRALIKRTAYGCLLSKLFDKQAPWLWYYEGLSGGLQGPFANPQMLQWYQGGYFFEQMRLCAVSNPAEIPIENQFCTIEEMLLYLTQPFYPSLAAQKAPLQHLKIADRIPDPLLVFFRREDIKKLPPECPLMENNVPVPEPTTDEETDIVERTQAALAQLIPPAVRLFLSEENRSWYYLGQQEAQFVHGPYSGELMFSWFRHGWLSEKLRVWCTVSDIVNLNRREFKPLKNFLENENHPLAL